MFSTRNSTLVSHSDGMFSHYSASTKLTNGYPRTDLIAFLATVQKCNVDYLPITWQPALSTLGVGGSGTISQSTFITDMPLAFKRFHHSGDSDEDFLPLMSGTNLESTSASKSPKHYPPRGDMLGNQASDGESCPGTGL